MSSTILADLHWFLINYGLSLLKILGVLFAFLGFERFESGTQSRLVVFISLAVALSAEIVDAQSHSREAAEMAWRFERLSRPLGSIKMRPSFLISLRNESAALKKYGERLEASYHNYDDSHPDLDSVYDDPYKFPLPDPRLEPAAHTTLAFTGYTSVSFYRHPVRVDPTIFSFFDNEPDLSFEISIGRGTENASRISSGPVRLTDDLEVREENQILAARQYHWTVPSSA